MSFWGCEVTETKAAVVVVPEGFVLNVCNATCGASSAEAQVALGLETPQLDGKAWKGAVAHLGGKQPLQVKLDLVFSHKVKFYLAKGSGAVNLTGYFQPGPLSEEETSIAVEFPKAVENKKSKKRARDEKKEEKKSWDEVSSSSGSEETSEKKEKAVKPTTTSPPAKEEQKKAKPAAASVVSSNDAAPVAMSQKKKRKKKHKKAAANGEAK